jgi:hypothetical protein
MRPQTILQSDRATRRTVARRSLFVLILLGIAAGSGAVVGNAKAEPPAPATPAGTAEAVVDTAGPHRVLAYYFHTTQRCATCRKIEAYTAEAVTAGFPEELKDGRLVFQALNVDEKGNEHFVKDYKLFTKSVVIVDERTGKQVAWKNLPKVWELVGDKERFVRYIQEETRAYLSGKQS